ncbi:hypothetical protein GQE99_20930 [Maritimibacter sp. DP07]|uniref:Right handed beta helix region n=1 Tax=Maritimibacter harenae TaxID=2606218 RepID=A0A845M808_9RHOB|nr:hypothetical protein [Maritimibacter harenae]MZR15482.1 hypothetical protein [Maritimibacter harenae]
MAFSVPPLPMSGSQLKSVLDAIRTREPLSMSVPEMIASPDLVDGDLCVTAAGMFTVRAAGAIANATSVIDLTGSGLQAHLLARMPLGTVAVLLADTRPAADFAAGDILFAQGFAYRVAPAGASDHDLTTAGGTKLYVVGQPDDPAAYGAERDGATDDAAPVQRMLGDTADPARIASLVSIGSRATLRDGAFVNEAATPMLDFATGSQNARVEGVVIDSTAGATVINANAAGIRNGRVMNATVDADAYGVLVNYAAADIEGFWTTFSDIHSDDADAIEINLPDQGTGKYIWSLGNLLSAGQGSTVTTAGFAVGLAGPQGHITALNQIRESRLEAIHVEDGQKRGIVALNTGAGLQHDGIRVLNRESTDPEADGLVLLGNHLRHDGAGSGVYGVRFLHDGNGTLRHNITLANYLAGFDIGVSAGSSDQVVGANVIEGATIGLQLLNGSGRITDGILFKDGPDVLAEAKDRSRIDTRLVSDTTPAQVLNHTGAGQFPGAYVKSFAYPVYGSHTGSETLEDFAEIFPMGANERIAGRITLMAHAQRHCFFSADILWDGATLTVQNMVEMNRLGWQTELAASAGKLMLRVSIAAAYTDVRVDVDFDGVYYSRG